MKAILKTLSIVLILMFGILLILLALDVFSASEVKEGVIKAIEVIGIIAAISVVVSFLLKK